VKIKSQTPEQIGAILRGYNNTPKKMLFNIAKSSLKIVLLFIQKTAP